MNQRIEGRLTQIGFQVHEVYKIGLELSESQLSDLQQDPARIVREFLEQEGQVVNSISLTAEAQQRLVGSTQPVMIEHAFHVVYPEGSRSGWICA